MHDKARSAEVGSVEDLDRRLLELLRAGHSTVTAGERLGLTLAETALRLQVLRRRLGVASTTAVIDLVCGGLPARDDSRKPPGSASTSPVSGDDSADSA